MQQNPSAEARAFERKIPQRGQTGGRKRLNPSQIIQPVAKPHPDQHLLKGKEPEKRDSPAPAHCVFCPCAFVPNPQPHPKSQEGKDKCNWDHHHEYVPEFPLGKNAVFKGFPVRKDATPKSGSFPVVVLAHGSGGNGANLAWIAAQLADQGMIVLAANHIGTTSGDSSPTETLKTWLRPMDQTALLDFAQTSLPLRMKPDLTRVGSIGFSLGGYTAIASAGARISKSAFEKYCATKTSFADKPDCGWFEKNNVDLSSIDQPRFERSNRDPRITTVVAIDPAVAQAYQPQSLRALTTPVQIINLGAPQTIPAGVDGTGLHAHLPNAELIHIKGSSHFSFLGECTKKGWWIITAMGDDPICTDEGPRKRADIHVELVEKITQFLAKTL